MHHDLGKMYKVTLTGPYPSLTIHLFDTRHAYVTWQIPRRGQLIMMQGNWSMSHIKATK